MDIQQVIALALGALALFFVGRHVWAEVRGLVIPSDEAGCPGCGGCDAAKAAASPQLKKTPLVTLQTGRPRLPEHLRPPKAGQD